MSATRPPSPLPPPGADQIIYAQVGAAVTLNPPEGFKSHNYYLQWTFGNHELAWSNYMGGKGHKDGERDI